MIHPAICNMIYSLRPAHHEILYLPIILPNSNTYPNYSQQPLRSVHRLRRGRNYILPTNQLMIRTSRSQHRRPSSRTLQPSRRCRTHSMHSMTSFCYKHMRDPTTPNPPTNPNAPPTRSNPSRNRQICPIRPSPLTSSCHRRPNSCLSPTTLKHNSSGRNLPTYPNPPTIQ